MSNRDTLRRHIRVISQHFCRYPNRPAPSTRTMDFAFETSQDHSDAVAACLMHKARMCPKLREGLAQWNVWNNDVWVQSFERHRDKSINQIIKETYPDEIVSL